MTTTGPSHLSPLVKDGNAAVFYTDGVWHRTESYPVPCTCGFAPQGVIKPALDESWKYCESKDVAGCLDTSIRAEPSLTLPNITPTPILQLGDRVEIDPRAEGLYEQGKSGEWFIEQFGKRGEDNVPIVRLIDRRTGVYVLAPLAWVKKWTPPTPEENSSKLEEKELRVSIPLTPSSDTYLWCVICGGDRVTHEFTVRSTQGRRSAIGIHLECARSAVGGGLHNER